MAEVIAVVFDFDKTLINGYMQEPLFKRFGINPQQFWKEVSELPGKYWKEQGVRVNVDTIYLNHVLNYVREGKFPHLSNKMLREIGGEIEFCKGIPEFFERLMGEMSGNKEYAELGIKLEFYIISTGFAELIKGTRIMPYISGVFGCEFIEHYDEEGNPYIAEVANFMDNTTKTKALYEISKGVTILNPQGDYGLNVNTKMPESLRRVHLNNIVYVADGPSDIPAFSVVRKNGGATFAVYKEGDEKSFEQADQLRSDGRVDMYAVADYSEGSVASMWITKKTKEMAERIKMEVRGQLKKLPPVPSHID